MRRRVLSTRCLTDDDDAKGAHVANALRVDAGIGVSKIYTKRAQRDATGHAKAFREAFTKIDCLINYLTTIPQMRLELPRGNGDQARKTHGTMSTWKNARVVVHIGSLLELHVSMLWRYGRCINLS